MFTSNTVMTRLQVTCLIPARASSTSLSLRWSCLDRCLCSVPIHTATQSWLPSQRGQCRGHSENSPMCYTPTQHRRLQLTTPVVDVIVGKTVF